MPRYPVADNGGEFPDLQSEAPIGPWSDAKRVLIQSDGRAMVARVEPSIKPRLGEKINGRPELCIEKKRQPRAEEIVDFAVDESRGRLLEVIEFQINCAAQARAKVLLERGKRQAIVESVDEVIDFERARAASQKAQAERRQQLHADLTAALGLALRGAQPDFKLRPIIG